MRTKLLFLTILTIAVVAVGKGARAEEGQFCGGFAGVLCPEGYTCEMEDNFPDAGGRCVANVRKELRDNALKAREGVREQVKETRTEAVNALKVKREAAAAQIKADKEKFRTTIEVKRKEVQEKIKTEREALKVKLQSIKDERKKAAVERIDARLGEINANRMNELTKALDKIEGVLRRVSDRADRAVDKGIDVAAVKTAVTQADTAIASARSAVTAQTGKTYPLAVAGEATLRMDVKSSRDALEKDLRAVREAVKAAHEAVRNAAVTLAQTPRINEVPTTMGTSTLSQ